MQGRFILAVSLTDRWTLHRLCDPRFSLATIPQNKGASTRTEFGDSQLLDLFVMPKSMTEGIDFRWAIGPYFVFPTATSKSAGSGAWQAGPAGSIQVPSHSPAADFWADSAGNFVRLYLTQPNSDYRVNVSANA